MVQDEWDVHIAAALNHSNVMQNILVCNCKQVELKDDYGDQPSHIAVRLGNVESLRVLVQFDAPMATRNYNLRTPMGEARMNGQQEVIRLLHDNYIFRQYHDGIDRHVYRRVYPSTIPSQTVARAAIRKLRHIAIVKRKYDNINRVIVGLDEFLLMRNTKVLQRWWRQTRCIVCAKKLKAATLVQTVYRMKFQRSFYNTFHKERLLFSKRRFLLAKTCQRLWRGYVDRAKTRKLLERRNLPDPNDPRYHDCWRLIQEESHPPLRHYGLFVEYILSGAPKTWGDRRLKRHGKYFRDVKFWVNEITRKVYWDKPIGCCSVFTHKSNYTCSVIKLQLWWRKIMVMYCLSRLAKAGRIRRTIQNIDIGCINSCTDDLQLYNYTFYVHVVLKQNDLAKRLYQTCLNRIQVKGVDNAFLLYSFAIFLASTTEGETYLISEMIQRGRLAEDRWKTFNSTTSSIYDVACWGFFRLQAITNESGDDWHQFGLCRFLVYNDLKGSKKALFRALQMDPKNQRVKNNLSALFHKENITVRFI